MQESINVILAHDRTGCAQCNARWNSRLCILPYVVVWSDMISRFWDYFGINQRDFTCTMWLVDLATHPSGLHSKKASFLVLSKKTKMEVNSL
jgi:hypothetical protein